MTTFTVDVWHNGTRIATRTRRGRTADDVLRAEMRHGGWTPAEVRRARFEDGTHAGQVRTADVSTVTGGIGMRYAAEATP